LDNKKEIKHRANWFLTLCKILQRRNAGLMQLKAIQLQKKTKKKLKIIGIAWIIDHAFSTKGKWH